MTAQPVPYKPQPTDEDGGFEALRSAVATTLKASNGRPLFISSSGRSTNWPRRSYWDGGSWRQPTSPSTTSSTGGVAHPKGDT